MNPIVFILDINIAENPCLWYAYDLRGMMRVLFNQYRFSFIELIHFVLDIDIAIRLKNDQLMTPFVFEVRGQGHNE